MKKKGQMKLSFGMIFSIILIVIFLIFSFYAIQKFLDFQKEIKYRQFSEDFQKDVDKLFSSTSGDKPVPYLLPNEVQEICFVDDEFGNLIFRPRVNRDLFIEHIDIEKTLAGEDELCIENIDGKVKFLIQKSYGENLVTVAKI